MCCDVFSIMILAKGLNAAWPKGPFGLRTKRSQTSNRDPSTSSGQVLGHPSLFMMKTAEPHMGLGVMLRALVTFAGVSVKALPAV